MVFSSGIEFYNYGLR